MWHPWFSDETQTCSSSHGEKLTHPACNTFHRHLLMHMNAATLPAVAAFADAAPVRKTLSCESRIIHQIGLAHLRLTPPCLSPLSCPLSLVWVSECACALMNGFFCDQLVAGAQQPRSERWAEAAESSHPLEHPPLPRWHSALGSLQGETQIVLIRIQTKAKAKANIVLHCPQRSEFFPGSQTTSNVFMHWLFGSVAIVCSY